MGFLTNFPRFKDEYNGGLMRLFVRELELLFQKIGVEFEVDRWDDLRFPAQGINPPGPSDAPARNITTGLLDFSGSADNIIAGCAQMPHEWRAGSIVRPHIHVMFPTAHATQVTRWKFEYNIASPNGDFTQLYGTYDTLSTITIANPNNVKKHVLGGFGDLDMTNFTESCCILWKITRLAGTDAADNHNALVPLLEFDIHYRRNKRGSVTEIPSV